MVLWEGRFKKGIDSRTNDFNSSIKFDYRMYKEDILGSIAHAKMLGKQDIISKEESDKIVDELNNILNDIEDGKLEIDFNAEDIHMFIETELTKRIGDTGKRLHTARSRNDQVALDIRMYLRKEIVEIKDDLKKLIHVFLDKALNNLDIVMPGYTHLQHAQPITYAHYMMAYVEMFLRDLDRLEDSYRRLNIMPLGSAALASTTYNIDRNFVKQELDFSDVTKNSLDGVSDRDFVLDLAYTLSLMMIHMSRFSEEVILWTSSEFKFIELDDSFSTGSSIMPQKKNPDITELVRGKTGRIIGDLNTLLVMMKGLPLAYNKDMQEDKEAIFDAIDNTKMCINILIPMVDTYKILKDNMLDKAKIGFINATDCADYLVKKGMPFRQAYKIVGSIVSYCIDNNKILETLSLDEYKKFNDNFDKDIYEYIDLKNCVEKRNVIGGPSSKQVKKRIDEVLNILN